MKFVTTRIAQYRTCRILLGYAAHALTVWLACCVIGIVCSWTCITRALVLLHNAVDYVLYLLSRYVSELQRKTIAGARAHQK